MVFQKWHYYRNISIMKRQLSIVVIAVTAVTWIAAATIFGLPDTFGRAILPFFTAITVTSLFLYVYDRYLWHVGFFQRWVAQLPDLQGVWKVTIRSTKINNDTRKQIDSVLGYAQIDQTASSLSMRLFTEDSRSRTIAYSIEEEQNQFRLSIVYENKPRMEERARDGTIHLGSAVYEFRGYRPSKVIGEYWTEKPSSGEIELSDRTRKEIDTYDAGLNIYSCS